MQFNESELKTLWQAATVRTAGGGACLSSEALMRAGADELSASEAEGLAAHLARCADCAEEYRIALTVRDWAAETAASHTAPAVRTQAQPRWWNHLGAFFNPMTAALTAALLLVSLALGAAWVSSRRQNGDLSTQVRQQRSELNDAASLKTQIEELQRREAELNARLAQQQAAGQDALQAELEALKKELERGAQPQLDLPQFDVDPNPETRGAGSPKPAVPVFAVPASAASFTINLPGAGSKPFSRYLIELLDAKTAKVVWSGQRKQDRETTFTLTLTKRNLPAGAYRIRVFGVNGKREPLASYELQLRYVTSKVQK